VRSLNRFFSRIRNFVTRRRSDERLREELEQHVALQTEENVRFGMSPVEGRRQALLKLGAIEAVRERYYEEKSLPLLECFAAGLSLRFTSVAKVSGLHGYSGVDARTWNRRKHRGIFHRVFRTAAAASLSRRFAADGIERDHAQRWRGQRFISELS